MDAQKFLQPSIFCLDLEQVFFGSNLLLNQRLYPSKVMESHINNLECFKITFNYFRHKKEENHKA